MPMQMRDGENRCNLSLDDEEHAERKSMENGSTTFLKDDRKSQRSGLDPLKCRAKFNQEFCSEAGSFSFVPRCCFEGVAFCFRADVEPRHLPTGAEAILYSFNDLSPRLSLSGGSMMYREALFQERLLPLLERYLINTCSDMVPERLDVIDLVFD